MNLADLLSFFQKMGGVELENVEIEAEELTLKLIPTIMQVATSVNPVQQTIAKAAIPGKPLQLEKTTFELPISTYTGEIAEVQIGATAKDGGTRKNSIKIGGEKCPPFYKFECQTPNRPVVALDVFDSLPPLPKTIKNYYRDVMDKHAEWINKSVYEYGADLVTLHLVSTDPSVPNSTSPKDAAKSVEKILDQVDVPLMIGGSGDPAKDTEVFAEVAKVAKGEKIVLASATVDMDLEKVANIVSENDQNLVALAFLDINQVKELNSKLLDSGINKTQLITDPSTGGLGYGIEYTFSMMERMRLAGLMGDPIMQIPISCAATNGWAAREAWVKEDSWGPREYRGPIWEAVTGIMGLFAGADLFMMMHPLAAQILKKTSEILSKQAGRSDLKEIPYENWVAMKI